MYRTVTAYFVAVSAAMVWPVYTLASRIEPTVLGLPFSLAYLTSLVILSFLVALGLYLWEDREGVLDAAERARRDPIGAATPRRHADRGRNVGRSPDTDRDVG